MSVFISSTSQVAGNVVSIGTVVLAVADKAALGRGSVGNLGIPELNTRGVMD